MCQYWIGDIDFVFGECMGEFMGGCVDWGKMFGNLFFLVGFYFGKYVFQDSVEECNFFGLIVICILDEQVCYMVYQLVVFFGCGVFCLFEKFCQYYFVIC